MTVREAVDDPESAWLTIAQTAKRLDLSEAQTRRLIRVGALHAEKFFNRTVILEASVRDYQRGGGSR